MKAENMILTFPDNFDFIGDINSKTDENMSRNTASGSDQNDNDVHFSISAAACEFNVRASGLNAASSRASNDTMPPVMTAENSEPLDPYTISGLVLVNSAYNVSSGYTVLDTTVNVGGTLNVNGGGQANDTVLNNGGAEVLLSGARANLTTVNWGGALHVYSGAAASRTTVNQSGYLGVGGGATVVSTTVGEIGEVTIWGGGFASQSVIETWGAIILSSGAQADGTDIRDKGGLHVYSGAAADNTTVNQGGIFGVGDGAVVNNTTIGVYGELKVWGGGLANHTNISSGGALILLSGAQASGTEIQSDGGLHVYSGASANSTMVHQGGYFGVGDGAVVNNTTIGVYGELKVWGGGLATDSVISSGGAIILLDNADADGTVISSGGGLHVYSGARASRTLVNQGGLFGVGGGANVVSTIVGQAGQVVVWGGGYAADNTIETWGAMILASGAQADRTDIHANGGLHIYTGALAENVTIRNGATLGIGGGGKVNGVTEEHGAGMVFYDGALVSGRIQMGGTVTVNGVLDASGATFVFDLSDRTSEEGIILNSMNAVSNANYQISLSGQEALGQYALAGDASGFSGSITITVNSETVGSVTAGGPALRVGDLAYSLFHSGIDTLLFDINIAPADTPPVFPDYSGSAEFDINGNCTLSWIPAIDDEGVTGYAVNIYDEGGQLATTLNSTVNSVKVLLPVGSYTFDVTAYDTAHNSITSPQTAFAVNKNIPGPAGNGTVQVYNNSYPILTTTLPLMNYVLPNAVYQMQVFPYGNAVSTTILGGAVATVNSYGNMYNAKIASGGYLAVRGGYSWDTEVNAGGGAIVEAGIANYNKISGFGAIMEVNNAGIANSVEIEDQGIMILKNGGLMVAGVVRDSYLYVSNGGHASSVVIASGGTAGFIESGAAGADIQIQNGGNVYVSCGVNIQRLNMLGDNHIFQIGIDSTTNVELISSGATYTISDGNMDSAIAGPGTFLEVYDGGVVHNLRTSGYVEPYGHGAGGAMQLSSGGTGYNVENHQSGQINVFSGGYLSGAVTDTEGEIYIYGGSADNIDIYSSGYLWIHSGGRVENIFVHSRGGLVISSGALVDGVTISGGHALVEESNAYVSNVEIHDNGIMQICGANVNNITISSGGLLTFSSGFYPMGKESYVMALNGHASNVKVCDGGSLVAIYTGSATGVQASAGAGIQVYASSLIRELDMRGGQLIVFDGGIVDNLQLTSGRGDIFTGGAVYEVNNNAVIEMQTGSLLGGEIYLSENGRVYAHAGSVIEFTLTGRTEDSGYLINNISRIEWSPSFRISVSSSQTAGLYKLAQGASGLNGSSMSVSVDGIGIGAIVCNGSSVSYGSYTYTASIINGDLTLSVDLTSFSASAKEDQPLFESAEAVDLKLCGQVSEPCDHGCSALESEAVCRVIDDFLDFSEYPGVEESVALCAADLCQWDETSSIMDRGKAIIA